MKRERLLNIIRELDDEALRSDESYKHLVQIYFNDAEEEDVSHEDLLFFVKDKSRQLEISRKGGSLDVLANTNWKETFYLNLICHLDYCVTIAVCIRRTEGTIQKLKEWKKQAYASPNKSYFGRALNNDSPKAQLRKLYHAIMQDFDKKVNHADNDDPAFCAELSYPLIYFSFHDFESNFQEIIVDTDQYLTLELAINLDDKVVSIFEGAVSFDAMQRVYESKNRNANLDSVEYIMMRGPHGKGNAQIAVSHVIPPPSIGDKGDEPSLQALMKTTLENVKSYWRDWSAPVKVSDLNNKEMHCALTMINIHWQSIINDLLKSIK